MPKRGFFATVRSFLFRVQRWKFMLAARVLPQRTAASGAALFCTPLRPATAKLQVDDTVPTPRLRQISLASGTVTLYEWGDSVRRPTILLLHGWNGWGLQFAAFVAPLLARGFAVVALDQRGHGRSAGRYASLPGFIATARELLACLPNLTGLVGHSLGAAAAACTVAQIDKPQLQLVLIAPPTHPRVFLEKFAALMGIPAALVDAMQQWMERRFATPFAQVGVDQVAPSIQTRTLVIHDAGDQVVPIAHGARYVELIQGARLASLQGYGHVRILQAPDAIRQTVAFLAEGATLEQAPPNVTPGAAAPAALTRAVA